MQKDIDEIWENLKQGNIVNNYYADWLKDELRPIEKIAIGKTRVFNVCNVAWNIVHRRLYGAIIAVITKSEFELGNALSFDMFGTDPSDLIKHLAKAGPYFFDHDVEKWDVNGMKAEYQHDCYENWNLVMLNYERNHDMFQMRAHAMLSITNRTHVIRDVMYNVTDHMPSGVGTTSSGNSDVHDHTSNMVYLEIMRENDPEISSLEQKEEHAIESKVGDDNIGAASQRAIKHYNGITICQNLAKYGISAVPPTKDGKGTVPYKTVTEVEFLKCKFRRDGRYWKATMREDTIKRLTNWIRKSPDDWEQLKGNLDDALRFAYGYGEAYFHGLKAHFNECLVSHGQAPLLLSYEDLDEEFRRKFGH